MKGIPKFFLRAKHWQIFLLFLGLGIVGNIVIFVFMSGSEPSQQFKQLEILNGIVTLPFLICFLSWFGRWARS